MSDERGDGRDKIMKSSERFSRSVIAVAVAVVGLVTAGTIRGAQATQDQIIPINANAYGNTYGEWSARWWQWLLSIPQATNPNLDTTGANCAQKQAGPVWFLAGAFSSSTVTRTCTVPAGKALFFPIVNAIFGAAVGDCKPTNQDVECNIADLRVTTAAAMDPVTLTASIDDQSLANLRQQRVQSPVLTITYPAGAVFGFPAGTFAPNVSDGYWLMLPPLPAGRHTIQFRGVISGGPFNGTVINVTYRLTVQSTGQ
jgi:hypothetical protein